MKKIFPKETVADILDRNVDEEIKHLRSEHDFPRSKTAILIATRINEDYNKYSTLLLNEMNEEIHFCNIRFGIKSAWTIAVVLAENLKEKDYTKLREVFDKWNSEEREELLEWLKDWPDHIKILTGKKV